MSLIYDSILNKIKENKIALIATAAGLTLTTAIVLNNIRKSGPHSTSLCILTGGLLGSPSIKSGESKETEINTENELLQDIKSVLNDYIINGQDIATQINIRIDNKEVLNYYAVDKNRFPDYNQHSIHTIFSSTKNIAALLIGIAVNKGWIESYDDNVIKYWPKFPTKYQYYDIKDEKNVFEPVENEPKYLKICDLLRHEGGLHQFYGDDKIIKFSDCDMDRMRTIIETSTLKYRRFGEHNQNIIKFPKSDRSYHGLTRGFLLNELFRKVEPKHRSMRGYIEQEITPILSKNDPNFKLYLKGKPKTESLPVIPIQNGNIFWSIYHLILPLMMNISFHLPKENYFNKYLSSINYSNFKRLNKIGAINKITKDKHFAPEWETAMMDINKLCKLFENEDDILMEWMSGSGITNAHSMTKLLSYFLFNGDDKMLKAVIAKPIDAFDCGLFTKTSFTQGGFNCVELHGITWYIWGGLGGSFYAFSSKYKCVYAYLTTGQERFDLGFDKDYINEQYAGRESRAYVLFYFLSKYLKSL